MKRAIAFPLLAALLACGGSGGDKTCITITLTYTGTHDGAVYVKNEVPAIGGGGLRSFPSVADVLREQGAGSNTGEYECWGGGTEPASYPATVTSWIDVAGVATGPCASFPIDAKCVPAATDPQGTTQQQVHRGVMNQIRVDMRDP